MIWTSQRSAYRGADGYRPTLTACAMKTTATPNGPANKDDTSVSAKVVTSAPFEDGLKPLDNDLFNEWSTKQTKPPNAKHAEHTKQIKSYVERRAGGKDGYRVLTCGVAHEDEARPKITESSAVVLFNMSASADGALTDQGTM